MRDLADRLARARARAAAGRAGLDAVLVTPGADLRYLTGYDARAMERLTCLALPADGEAFLVVPRLEEPAALASPAGTLNLPLVTWGETDDPYALVASRLPAQVGRVGLDNQMWFEKAVAFRAALPQAERRLAGEVLRTLRIRKSPDEVEALRRAAAAIDRVHERVGEWLRAGRTERAIGRDIAEAILAEGHVRVDFVIVGSGPNGASPHHDVSDRVVRAGEPVVVDIGGTAAVRPGVTAQQLDSVGRDIIADAGYGPYFVHRTGHGIGIYLPGRYGARIEDIVVCTPDGGERLNRGDRELVVLGPAT